MTRARDTANALDTFRNRNLIINGAAEVYQRGAATTSHNGYAVDRWQLKNTSGATCTSDQSTDAPPPFKNSIKFTAGGTSCSAAEPAGIAQRMEGNAITSLGWGTSAAQPATLSFYVKSSVTGTYAVSARNSVPDQSYVNTYTISSANTWEYKTVTFDARTTGTWLTTNGIGIRLWFDLGSGSNLQGTAGSWTTNNHLTVSSQVDVVGTSGATWFVTGVQLEVGDTATPFEHRSFGEELSLCQRYYEEWGGEDAYQPFGYFEGTGTVGYSVLQFTEKRAAPTVTVSDVAHFQSTRAGVVFSAMTFSQPAPTHVFCTISRSSNNWTSGEIFSWRANASGSARIYFNAEL